MKQNLCKLDINSELQSVLRRVLGAGEFFKSKTVLVTGATGFFGWWMLSSLLQMNKQFGCEMKIHAVSRDPDTFLKENSQFKGNVAFIKSDLRDLSLAHVQVDYCFHMATTSASETFNEEDQLNKIDLLYLGTKKLMSELVKAKVKKIVFTSSGVVYGSLSERDDYLESSRMAPLTTNPASALGEGKRLAEYVIAYYCASNNISYGIARCFSFVGPRLPMDLHYAIGNFIYDALHNESIAVRGTGRDIRSYLYIGDAITWLLNIMISVDNEQIYNVGSGHPISIMALAETVRDLLAPEKKVIVHDTMKTEDNFDRNIYVPNVDKITAELSVEEWSSLRESILKTALYSQE